MRARSVLIEEMAKLFATVDVIVTPSGGPQLTATNLSGHPAVIVPNGIRGTDAPQPQDTADGGRGNAGGPGTPVSITFLGQLYDDARLLAFAQTYQEKTGLPQAAPSDLRSLKHRSHVLVLRLTDREQAYDRQQRRAGEIVTDILQTVFRCQLQRDGRRE